MRVNPLDRLIGFLAPRAELRRAQARIVLQQVRSYEGATKGRIAKNWKASNSSANAGIALSIETLIARSRQLAQDNPWAASAVDVITGETIGTGIIPQTKSADEKLVKRLESLWIDWADETAIDADGKLDFYGLQSLILATVVKSGSCLVRRRWRRPGDGLPVPMQIQVLEPDYLDASKDAVLASGGRIIRGIEFDPIGRRVAYHLYQDHPGNGGMLSLIRGAESKRVPATEICHVYRVDRPGQATGVPWASPILLRIRGLDEFEEAELIRQKIAACFAAFVHDVEAPDDLGGTNPTAAQTEKREILERIEPGIIEQLGPGKTITFGQPPQTNGYEAHSKSVLRAIAKGYGVSYESLTGDLSNVNFSSGRMGWIQMQANVEKWRSMMMVPQLCKPVWRWFVEAAVMAGEVRDFAPATWTSPRRKMIDPTKETAALKEQVRNGFKTWSEAIREAGYDPEEVATELAADYERFDDKGLMLDCDPRKRTSIGYSPNDTKKENAAEAPVETDDEKDDAAA